MPKQKVVTTVRKKVPKTIKKTAKKMGARKKAVKKAVKKAPKKSVKSTRATKKVSSKKTMKALVCAKDGECFWTTDGSVLRDLSQLQLAFGTMKDEVFLHHVTKEKNDFADWVDSVLKDSGCAKALRRSRRPSSARTVVMRYIRLYNN